MATPRRLSSRAVALAGVATATLIVVAAAALGMVALLSRLSPAEQPPSSAATPIETPLPRPALDQTPPPPTADTPGEPEFVRVANTGGSGAFLRDEPRGAARGIVAHTDRAVLKVIGSDQTSEGRTWRNVEDIRGNRGWTPAEFLVPSDVGF